MKSFIIENRHLHITEKINTTVIHKLNKLKEDNKLVVGYRGILYGINNFAVR